MTIAIYIVAEMISMIFLHLAQKYRNNSKRKKGKIKVSTILIVLSILPLIFLIGFRALDVGVDTERYSQAFYRTINNTLTPADEKWLGIGYILINKLVGHLFGNNYIIVNLLIGSMTIGFFYKAFWDNSKMPTLSLYIFISTCLYYQTFNQSRQMLAIAIILYSMKYIKERNLIKYIITVLLATSIHNSAIIMLPFYYIANMKLSKKNILIYIAICIFSYFSFDIILKLINETSYGQIYQTTSYYKSASSSIINLFVRVVMLIGCILLYKKNIAKDKEEQYLYNMIIWCTLFQVLTLKMYILGRITTYFFVAYLLLIPNTISKINISRKNKCVILFMVLIFFMIYHYVYFNSSSAAAGYDTYKFIFLGI